jgi:hypothetical protein
VESSVADACAQAEIVRAKESSHGRRIIWDHLDGERRKAHSTTNRRDGQGRRPRRDYIAMRPTTASTDFHTSRRTTSCSPTVGRNTPGASAFETQRVELPRAHPLRAAKTLWSLLA